MELFEPIVVNRHQVSVVFESIFLRYLERYLGLCRVKRPNPYHYDDHDGLRGDTKMAH